LTLTDNRFVSVLLSNISIQTIFIANTHEIDPYVHITHSGDNETGGTRHVVTDIIAEEDASLSHRLFTLHHVPMQGN
jgi:hypothetical protein